LGRFRDGENDSFKVLQHIIIGEAQNAVTATDKPSIAPYVGLPPCNEIVALAIEFDNKTK
jgi:hypothetical protein